MGNVRGFREGMVSSRQALWQWGRRDSRPNPVTLWRETGRLDIVLYSIAQLSNRIDLGDENVRVPKIPAK